MNISPDDFEKFGIDSTILDDKKEQTTYKIRYVVRYVKQWAIIEAERPKINQINFVDCMCNAGVYKDGDFCTALEVIKVFNELAGNPKYQAKQFVVYLNDIDAGRIENFKKVILQVIKPNKNLHVCTSSMDVNVFLGKVADSTHSLHNRLFAFGNCNLIYVDPYNFGTVSGMFLMVWNFIGTMRRRHQISNRFLCLMLKTQKNNGFANMHKRRSALFAKNFKVRQLNML